MASAGCPEHGQVRVAIATGNLITGFCASCSGWLETIIDPDLAKERVFSSDMFDREVTVGGTTRSLREWARVRDVSAATIYKRIHRGWSTWSAVMSPLGKRLRDEGSA